ncbi:uncharacterized protein LOC100906100, partial [Galendromus occidentalis]|uniref:Uncharacterized protein LOC100906100 n=1 Tax=Galendromus occidentalis TaxID=34638 RepID=A0AAJ6VUZ9_9ACAR
MALLLKEGVDKVLCESLQDQRKNVRRQVTRRKAPVEAMFENPESANVIKLDTEENLIRQLRLKLERLNEQISAMLATPGNEEERTKHDAFMDRAMEYEETIFEMLAKIEFLRRGPGEDAAAPSTSATQDKPHPADQDKSAITVIKDVIVKQQDKIPKFAGDAKKFQEWFELFGSATTTCTSPLEKFKRLKSSLVGSALKQISHLHLKEELYQRAIDIIKDEYGSVFSAQYAYASELINNCNSRTFKNPDKWHALIPVIAQNIRALKTLIEGFDGAAVMILPIILDNLPSSVRDAFLRVHEVSKSDEANKQLDALPRDNHSFYGNQESQGNHACLFCGLKNHASQKCRKVLSSSERAEIVRKTDACAKCLRRNHVASKCRLKTTCRFCRGCRNSLLCEKSPDAKVTSTLMGASNNAECNESDHEARGDITEHMRGNANLATGYAYVVKGPIVELRRLLLDIGSQRSYITEKLAKSLRAKAISKEHLINHTLGGQASEVEQYSNYEITIRSRFEPNASFSIVCLGIPVITRTVFPPAGKLTCDLDYADRVSDPVHKNIDILIGNDHIGKFWLNESRSEGSLIGLRTRLGWFTFGKKEVPSPCTTTLSVGQLRASVSTEEASRALNVEETTDALGTPRDIEFMFRSELSGIEPPEGNEAAIEAKKYDEIFLKGIRRLPSGRYSLKLPFNDKIHVLGDNEQLAQIRLKTLISRSSPEILKAADDEVASYIRSGFAERAPERKKGEFAHYLPIQVVKKPAPESELGFKIRLVKDAGARSKDLASLNDVLIAGPNLLPNILRVLARFRNSPIVIISDIEKAFHQFEIDQSHRTFLRFFWRPGISTNPDAPLRQFWSKRLDFGLISSPWLHQAGLKYHLEFMKRKYPNEAEFIDEIMYSAYMDDLSFSANSINEARDKAKRCEAIFAAAKFPLRKWACNNVELARMLEHDFADQNISVRVDESDFKFLGVRWCQVSDTLGVFVDRAVQSLRE